MEANNAEAMSQDLRVRLIEAVRSGASRREAAESLDVSASSGVRWMQRWCTTGGVAAKPSGGRSSPLEKHAPWLLALVADKPDLTLDEIVIAMRKRRIAVVRQRGLAVLQSTKDHLKKACTRRNKSERTWRGHADAGCGIKAYLTRPDWCSSMKPQPAPIWDGCGAAAHAASV